MALVSATLTISFPANFIGCHRVCYRINNSGGYTCVNTTCIGSGAQCSVDVGITVDNETCPTIEFDGYAQACCEDVSSLEGRIPFSVTFTPSPSCKRYLATCNNVPLFSVTMVNKGTSYASAPSVSFSGGGGGSGAAAHAVIGVGVILTSHLATPGVGYVNNTTYTNVSLLGGSGSGAQATVTTSGNVVTLVSITNFGTGYQNSDTLQVDDSLFGGSGTKATVTITTDYHTVTGIVMDLQGSGYTAVPFVIIGPSSGGIQATAIANLGYCGTFSVNSCTGTGFPVGDSYLQPGQSVDFCTAGTPPAPNGYTITQDTGNCLCNCQSTTLTATGPSGTVNYRATLCNGSIITGTINPTASPSSLTACLVSGSLIIQNVGAAVGVISYNGNC